jgi:CDGSH-type Zn-finger protein
MVTSVGSYKGAIIVTDVSKMRIDVTPDGPYAVTGSVPLLRVKIVTNDKGESLRWEQTYEYPLQECYVLCRCGHSRNKPFCDASHCAINFDGTETASKTPYAEEAEALPGKGITLFDDEHFCVGARFCDRASSVWSLTEGSADPAARKLAIEEASLCPSGRLVMRLEEGEREGLLVEPDFPSPSIALIEDPINGASGPLWVRGGIPLYGADDQPYELRNRMTLCRCGASRNKPFCDGNHYRSGFKDGFERE